MLTPLRMPESQTVKISSALDWFNLCQFCEAFFIYIGQGHPPMKQGQLELRANVGLVLCSLLLVKHWILGLVW